MGTSMKKLVGFIILIGALLLASYYITGLVTEHTFRKSLDIINQSNGISAKINKYNLGWYKSTAIVNISMHIPERVVKNSDGQSMVIAEKDEHIDVPLSIYHGPILYADSKIWFGLGYIHSNVLLPELYSADFDKLFTKESKKPNLIVSAFINYLNKISFHAIVPKFNLVTKQGNSQFEWLGMVSDLTISSARHNVNGDIRFEGAHFIKDDVDGALNKLRIDYNLNKNSVGFYLGKSHMTLSSVDIKQQNHNLLSLVDATTKTYSGVQNELFRSQLEMSFAKLIYLEEPYGPAHLTVAIKNIDAGVLAEINAQLNQIQQSSASAKQQVLFTILPALPKLLRHGAQFDVLDLFVNAPEGKLTGMMTVSLPDEEISNPFQLIQSIKGTTKLTITDSLFKSILRKRLEQTTASENVSTLGQQIDEKTANLIKVGLLSPKGSDYEIAIDYTAGKLMVNGHEFNSAMIQF